MTAMSVDYCIGAILVLIATLTVWWQQKSLPPDSVSRLYPRSLHFLVLIPFRSLRKLGVEGSHVGLYRDYRFRTWVLLVVSIGGLEAFIIYLWLRHG
jgi:hypothetical protein